MIKKILLAVAVFATLPSAAYAAVHSTNGSFATSEATIVVAGKAKRKAVKFGIKRKLRAIEAPATDLMLAGKLKRKAIKVGVKRKFG